MVQVFNFGWHVLCNSIRVMLLMLSLFLKDLLEPSMHRLDCDLATLISFGNSLIALVRKDTWCQLVFIRCVVSSRGEDLLVALSHRINFCATELWQEFSLPKAWLCDLSAHIAKLTCCFATFNLHLNLGTIETCSWAFIWLQKLSINCCHASKLRHLIVSRAVVLFISLITLHSQSTAPHISIHDRLQFDRVLVPSYPCHVCLMPFLPSFIQLLLSEVWLNWDSLGAFCIRTFLKHWVLNWVRCSLHVAPQNRVHISRQVLLKLCLSLDLPFIHDRDRVGHLLRCLPKSLILTLSNILCLHLFDTDQLLSAAIFLYYPP